VVAAGRPVQLDASHSRDPEGLPLVYEWDLDGDGAFETGSGTTARATRTFGREGQVTLRIRVNDPHGGRSVAEASVLVDGAIPVINRLSTTSRVLALRRGRGGPPRAATVRFELSEPAQVTLSVERARRGRRALDGQCRVRARRGRRCTRWVPERTLEHEGAAGANAVLVRARGLHAGRHRIVLNAVDAVGNASSERSLRLGVVRGRPPARGSS
jgi:hypothetical protein